MNKNELVSAVAEKAEMSKKDAEKAVSAIIDTITGAMASGDKVQLIGFGTFEARERSEKQARNPRTGEMMTVAACKVPAFKPGQALKNAVN
ncbi:MAG TPA: DNA-binding protein [Ruminococcaceae bacterium]|nr:DNA-binding protein [Oscillospiraceae bacterium]